MNNNNYTYCRLFMCFGYKSFLYILFGTSQNKVMIFSYSNAIKGGFSKIGFSGCIVSLGISRTVSALLNLLTIS